MIRAGLFLKRVASLFLCAVFFSKILLASVTSDEMPDFLQTSQQSLPGEGEQYCAPAAVSNSLMFLSRHGFPNLAPKSGGSPEQIQYKMVAELAGPLFMDTDGSKGTSPSDLLKGVEAYVLKKGYTVRFLSFQGWRARPPKWSGEGDAAEPAWAVDKINLQNTGVWLNIGWYRKTPVKHQYERSGGHWVTVVSGSMKSGSPELYIHDPAPRAGKSKRTHRIQFKKIEKGNLIGNFRNLPQRAEGKYLILGELKKKKGADYAILDGVAAIQIGSLD